eukprot:CAMPEP_0201658680 /NCGR_PEP_ID=MMETSP0494-20130426/1531_1 /ASSEMBLY_ACC=CAM_ASM_000839 /TAXON_ID=420259 /ORGANISM="Thalassiosira gravida, Strain GMp14c1" /LENGTH=34 /DNA_ID= /DNA_START= /DNA_END= /DNA_ORIENTATION=
MQHVLLPNLEMLPPIHQLEAKSGGDHAKAAGPTN